MFYPEDFKTKVKKAYPSWEELHRRLDSGDYIVGRYLYDSSSSAISLATVLAATSLEELKKEAKAELEKVELYNEWSRLYNEQNHR